MLNMFHFFRSTTLRMISLCLLLIFIAMLFLVEQPSALAQGPGTPTPTIPPPAATPTTSGDDIVTALLLGSDTITPVDQTASRTDVIIVAAIDRTAQTVTMLHIPRDMWVYVPNYESMKINTVMNYGNVKIGPGKGIKLLEDAILYNYGIKINFFARVNFVGFENIVKDLGGLDISVDCALQGHRLKDPKLDYYNPDSWELYTLPIGRHVLSPYMALWFVRSRGSSSDLDRGSRQIDALRSLWRQAKASGALTEITKLWPETLKWVETDVTLTDAAGFVPTALALEPASIQRIEMTENVDFTRGLSSNDGEFIFIPIQAGWTRAVQTLMTPPTKNRIGGENPTVEIGASLYAKGFDQVGGDRLSWEGFNVKVLGAEGMAKRDETIVYDYTGGQKPASLKTLVKDLRVTTQVVSKPDPNATVDFHVEMGTSYGKTCLKKLPDTLN